MSEDKDNKWSVNYSWNQPYQYTYTHQERLIREWKTVQELQKIFEIDAMVEKMETYPDAEAIIQKVQNEL